MVEKAIQVETPVKTRVKEGCKVLGSLKSVMNCWTLGMEAKRGYVWGSSRPICALRGETVG